MNLEDEPRITQKQLCNQVGFFNSTFKRYGNDIKMLSPYRIQSNTTNKRSENNSSTNSDNNSHREHERK